MCKNHDCHNNGCPGDCNQNLQKVDTKSLEKSKQDKKKILDKNKIVRK
jgi:hypothetical protein